MRASSWNNSRRRLPLCVSAMPLTRSRPLFKGLLSGRVFLRVAGSRLLSREAEAAHNTRQRGGMIVHVPTRFHQRRQVLERVGRETLRLRIGARKDRLRQLGLASPVELARAARLWPVVKTVEAVRVVALDSVA